MTHKEIKMEHVFNQSVALQRNWHSSGANETSVAGVTRESWQFSYGRGGAASNLAKTDALAKMCSLHFTCF